MQEYEQKKIFFAVKSQKSKVKSEKSKVKSRPSISPLKGDFNRDYDTG